MRPQHSVIYTGGGGRLGNQLIRCAHWLAWARAQAGNVEVINLAFWPFAEYFATWTDNRGCIFPPRRSDTADLTARLSAHLPAWLRTRMEWRWQKLVQNTGRWWPRWQSISLQDDAGEEIDLDSPTFAARISRCRVTTCEGWKIAGWQHFSKQQAELRSFFVPAHQFVRQGRDFIAALRQNHDIVAGLLIRQTDYRQWRDGRFYFSGSQYATWIRQLLDVYAAKRVAVVVASDERQDPDLFAGLPCYFATGSANAGGHWFESFVQLSGCDFVMSPPSTFSTAATFVGNIPLWPLVDENQTLAQEQLMINSVIEAARHPVFSAAVK